MWLKKLKEKMQKDKRKSLIVTLTPHVVRLSEWLSEYR